MMRRKFFYYSYGSWYDGGIDIGYFNTRAKAIAALYDFLVREKYEHECFVVKIKLNETLRIKKRSLNGSEFYSHRDQEKVFEAKPFFMSDMDTEFRHKLKADTRKLYKKWKSGMRDLTLKRFICL